MYINFLHLPLFNFAYVFFPFVLSFPLNIFVRFVLIALFSTWHLDLVLFSSLCLLVLSLIGKYNFLFPLFTGSIYCSLHLLDCFHFAYECICICVYSIILIIICNCHLSGVHFGFSLLDICFTLP